MAIDDHIAGLPASIAPFAARLVGASRGDNVHQRCMAQIALFEVTLRYLACVACAGHFQTGLHDDKVRRALRGLNHPSLGHWLAVWRETARAHAGTSGFPVPELLRLAAVECAVGSACHTAHTRLCELYRKTALSRRNRPISMYQFFEIMVVHRNGLFHYPSAQQEGVLKECDLVVGPALEETFHHLEFLRRYQPVFVRQIRFHRGQLVHEIERCLGPADPVTETYVGEEPLAQEAGRLILARAEMVTKDGEERERLSPVLDLEPLILRHVCSHCQRVGLFSLSKRTASSLEYTAACPHAATFPDSPERLTELIGRYEPAPTEDKRLRPDGPASLEDAAAAAPQVAATPATDAPESRGAAPTPVAMATVAERGVARSTTRRRIITAVAIALVVMIGGVAAYVRTRSGLGPLEVNLIEVGTGVDEAPGAVRAVGVASSFPMGTSRLVVVSHIAAPGTRPAHPWLKVYRDGELQVHLQKDLGPLEPNRLSQSAWEVESNPEFKPGRYEVRVYNGAELVATHGFAVREK